MRNLRLALGVGAMALASTVAVLAQQGVTDDPANLKGEQVKALRGDEIPQNVGAKALWQNLLKLKTRASLLMIVAHPDDEDGGMLTYEVRGQGVRAAMLTLTRGEGGQNLMSADFNDALGLVRTEELLSADQYSGIDQMFGTEVDFGFSKSREEALAQWTHDRVLYDAVRAVRLFRPLVVTSVFVGGPTDGHGHHQVAGEMAQEVFNAAADPKVFPEMGLPVWAPLKVYSRAPNAGVQGRQIFDSATGKYVPLRFFNYVTQTWSDAVPGVNVVIHEGDVSPMLGMSYVQFAREGLGLQKTQIGNSVRRGGTGGAFDVRYHCWASRVPAQDQEQSFFDGVDASLAGIAALAPKEKTFLPQGLAKLQGLVDQAVAGYSESEPGKIAPVLKDALITVRGMITEAEKAKSLSGDEKYNVLHELRAKEVQANDALAEAIGLKVDAWLASAAPVVPDANLKVWLKASTSVPTLPDATHHFIDSGGVEEIDGVVTVDQGKSLGTKVQPDANECFYCARPISGLEVHIPANEIVTRPYFSRPNFEQPFYNVTNPQLRNAPETPSPLTAWVTARYEGVSVRVGEVVQTGENGIPGPRQVMVVPAVSVAIAPTEGILLPGMKSVPLDVLVHGSATGTVKLTGTAGWQITPASGSFHATETTLHFNAIPTHTNNASTVAATAEVDGKQYIEGYRIGGYDPRTSVAIYSPATYRAHAVDVKVAPGLRIGYIEGTGDDVPQYLKAMGVPVTILNVSDLSSTVLADFDVVVLGVRAFTAHGDLEQGAQALMDFVKNGGTTIVQYDTARIPDALAPYPLTLGGDAEKVVEENSKMVLAPGTSTVMQWPNAISEKDFDGWVEERGHGFMRTWDPRYETPTETHDAGQDPQHGGLLVANYGKGHYVYCAYALYRQMPEGIPGAYRLFANMLSLGKAPATGGTR